jgi:phosphomannomutase/phosphoglucomutase
MITGSHNPAEFNGFKLSIGPSTFGDRIQHLREIIARDISGTEQAEENKG